MPFLLGGWKGTRSFHPPGQGGGAVPSTWTEENGVIPSIWVDVPCFGMAHASVDTYACRMMGMHNNERGVTMINEQMYAYGAASSKIREIFS